MRRDGSCRRRTTRSGFSLVELLFAITAISGLAVLAITVISLLMSAEQHAAEALWIDVTVASLATDLREDAHDATAVESVAAGDGRVMQVTLLQPDDVRLTYECTDDGVIRRRLQRGELVATETYRLAFGTSWFAPPTDDGTLTWTHAREVPVIGGFTQPTPDQSLPQRTYQIVAAIGLHAAIAGEESE